MASRFNVVERTNCEYLIMEPILKSQFLDIDDKEMGNVNKGGRRMGKHAKLWVKNAFDEWRLFCGFDTINFITNLFENKGLIKGLVDVLSSFILEVTKKMVVYILQPSTFFVHFYNKVFFCCKYHLRFRVHVCLCPLSFCLVYVFARYVFLLDMMFVSRFRFRFRF